MYSKLNRAASWVDFCLKWYIIILMALMVGMTFIQVVARYVMRSPFTSTEEYTRMVLVWVTFIGAAVALRRNKLTGLRFWRNIFLSGLGSFWSSFLT